jgi:hypothetical protein
LINKLASQVRLYGRVIEPLHHLKRSNLCLAIRIALDAQVRTMLAECLLHDEAKIRWNLDAISFQVLLNGFR